MRIAHIHASARNGNAMKYYVDYLTVTEEDDTTYTVADHRNGLQPRGNWLSKEIDYDAADDGYASLNMPCWLKCEPYEVSGVIYVREDELEKGKEMLKKALLENVDKQIKRFEKLKELIEE